MLKFKKFALNEAKTIKVSFHSAAAKAKWMKKQSVDPKEIISQTKSMLELPASMKQYVQPKDHDEIYSMSIKEESVLGEAFKKGDSVTVKNARKYDALSKPEVSGTVIGMNGNKVMVKVGSGQMNVDARDLMKESVELGEAALLENLSAWRDAGIDADVAKKVLKGFVYSNKPTFEPVTRPKASEVSDGALFAGKDSNGNSVVVFKKPYEGMHMSGKPYYVRVGKDGTTNTDSIQKAFNGLKGPYVKLAKGKYSFDDGNTRKSTGGQSVDQAKAQWGRDPLAGQTPISGWAGYMNKTFMPELKPKLDRLVDEIYANLRKLPKDLDRYNRKTGSDWMKNPSQREDAVKLASAIETIAEKGFSDKTVEDYLQSMGKRSGGFGSYYTNEKNFKQAMAEPMGRQKFAKFLLASVKDLHDEVMDMVRNASDADKAEKKLRGESMKGTEVNEATDFRPGDTVYQVGSKLKGTVQHKGNRDLIAVKFGSINQMIPASRLRLAEEVELDEAKGSGVKKFVRGMRVQNLNGSKGTVIKGGDNLKKAVEVEWDNGQTTLASAKYLKSMKKNESVELGEAKKSFEKGDSVKIINAKKYDALAKPEVSGIVIGMAGSKVMVKVGSGQSDRNNLEYSGQMNVDPKDLVKESVELGEAKISVGDRVTLQPNKNTLDRSLIGKAGVVTGMVGSKPTVKFANGKTIVVSPNDLKLNESVELGEAFTPKDVKMAIGIASDKRYAGGNMTGAVNAIEKIKKGLSDHPQVKAVLRKQNESLGEAGYRVPSNYAALMLKKRKQQQKAAAKEKWGKDDAEYLKKNTQKEEVELDELDSKTYRSYHDKATADQLKRMDKEKQTDKDRHTMRKRSLGIATAGMKQYGDKRTVKQRIRGEEVELGEAGSTDRLAIIKQAAQRVKERQAAADKKAAAAAKRDMKVKGAQRGMAPLKKDLDENSRSFPFQGSNDHAPKNIFQPPLGSQRLGSVTFLDKDGKKYNPVSKNKGTRREMASYKKDLDEGRNEALKALEALVKNGGIDKASFQKAYDLYKANKLTDLRKHIYSLDTDPGEEIVRAFNRKDSKSFNSMYPRAKAGEYFRKIIDDHGGK